MEYTLWFERFDDARIAADVLAKSEGITRVSHSHGAEEIEYSSGLLLKFRTMTKASRERLARQGCPCQHAAT